jgi:hypothetical protein
MEFEDTNGDDVAPRKKETVLYGAEPLFNTQTQRWILAVARGFLGSQSVNQSWDPSCLLPISFV